VSLHSFASRDLEAFNAFVAAAPVLDLATHSQLPDTVVAGEFDTAPTDHDRHLATLAQSKPEDIAKERAKLRG
jgi:hypothetical protein